jgi:hypothetical protein
MKQASPAFLKKSSKKLLHAGAGAAASQRHIRYCARSEAIHLANASAFADCP